MNNPVGIFSNNRGEVEEYVDDYHFDVREEGVQTASGLEIEGMRSIVREDNNAVLGTVGSSYQVLSHEEALDPILNALQAKGLETHKRVVTTKGGARLYANLYFPSEETSIGSSTDKIWPGISVTNSLDGSLKYDAEATIYRLVCSNGMRKPTTVAGFSMVHSKNKDFSQITNSVVDYLADGEKFGTFQMWASKVMTPERMNALAEVIVERSDFPKRYLPMVQEEIQRETQFGVANAWGLYNSFNSILEHNLIREKGKYDRARTLDGNLFKTFEKVLATAA
jgi:hypothetical protein